MIANECIGVIGGTGDQGWGLALRWAAAGKHVRIGSRQKERAQEAARKITERLGRSADVQGLTNEDLVASTSLLVLAVPFLAQVPTILGLRGRFQHGQLLIDCTVPLETAIGGSPTRMIALWEGSAAEQAARHVPADVHVAGAFHNISSLALRKLELQPECDVLVCSDTAEDRHRVRPWVEAIPGCRYVDGGKLENARIIEPLTALLIGINRRYKVQETGFRISGLPE